MSSRKRVSNVPMLAKMSRSPKENGSQGSRKRLVGQDIDEATWVVNMREQGRSNMKRRPLGKALGKAIGTMGQVGFDSKKDDLVTLIPQLADKVAAVIKKKRGNIVEAWNFALGVSNASRLPAMFWEPELWSAWVLLRWEKIGLERFNLVIDAMPPDGNIDWNAITT